MKSLITMLAVGGMLAGAALAQDSTLPSHSMPSDSALTGGTNGFATNSTTGRRTVDRFGTDTLHRSTNSSLQNSNGTLNNNNSMLNNNNTAGGQGTETRVDTKAGTTAQPIRGSQPSGNTGGATALPSPSAPNF